MKLSSLKSKHQKPALLQDKLLYSTYLQVFDDHFAVLMMAVNKLLSGLNLILTQIRAW